MGISLTGLTPSTTYDALIKVGDNGPIDGTLKTLSDGLGNDLPMEVSTTGVNFTNQLQQGGVAVPTASQVAAKQDTLVSGTNIKTINGASVLGSGNIVTPTTSPSGVSGAIQFSNGSAFASDDANLFWDDTNNRLGVGTNAPSSTVDINSNTLSNAMFSVGPSFATGFQIFNTNNTATPVYGIGINGSYINTRIGFYDTLTFRANGTQIAEMTSSEVRVGSISGARLGIKGSGSTSATTSLLVQNSAGRTALKVADNGVVTIGADDKSGEQLAFVGLYGTRLRILTNSSVDGITGSVINSALDFTSNDLILSSKAASTTSNVYVIPTSFTSLSGSVLVNTTTDVASSVLTVNSTTKGVLFPRMTTTQRNAITSPAAGLVVYDSTTNKLCCYNGSTWNDLF